MDYAHTTYPVTDGRIRVAKVDCTSEVVRTSSIRPAAPRAPPRRAAGRTCAPLCTAAATPPTTVCPAPRMGRVQRMQCMRAPSLHSITLLIGS